MRIWDDCDKIISVIFGRNLFVCRLWHKYCLPVNKFTGERIKKMETERLVLREMTSDDFGALYEVLADSDIMKHYPYTFDEKRVRNWINKNIERYRILGFGLWAVCLKDTGEMIGDCGLTMQNIDGFIMPEIGYHIAKKHQHRGYAKEAAGKCRDWAFLNTPFGAVYSYMHKDNIASSATARANGMRLVKEFTDTDGAETSVYGITREEWDKKIKESEITL